MFTFIQAISGSLTEVYNSIAYKRFKVIQKGNFPVWNATDIDDVTCCSLHKSFTGDSDAFG